MIQKAIAGRRISAITEKVDVLQADKDIGNDPVEIGSDVAGHDDQSQKTETVNTENNDDRPTEGAALEMQTSQFTEMDCSTAWSSAVAQNLHELPIAAPWASANTEPPTLDTSQSASVGELQQDVETTSAPPGEILTIAICSVVKQKVNELRSKKKPNKPKKLVGATGVYCDLVQFSLLKQFSVGPRGLVPIYRDLESDACCGAVRELHEDEKMRALVQSHSQVRLVADHARMLDIAHLWKVRNGKTFGPGKMGATMQIVIEHMFFGVHVILGPAKSEEDKRPVSAFVILSVSNSLFINVNQRFYV